EGKVPVVVDDLRAMVTAMTPRRGQAWRLLELRDRALLLIGFAGAFRRSELVGLDVADLEFSSAGLVIKSAPFQDGSGGAGPAGRDPARHRETCPVTALHAYLSHAGIQSGAVF